jgi:hypothetical protein
VGSPCRLFEPRKRLRGPPGVLAVKNLGRSYYKHTPLDGAWSASVNAASAVGEGSAMRAEQAAQCELLREIFGNLFRPAPPVTDWLAWHGGAIRDLAQDVYVTRRFEPLPILADMPEEAGCADRDLLAHLRAPGPHVRGCWAVDLLMGRDVAVPTSREGEP